MRRKNRPRKSINISAGLLKEMFDEAIAKSVRIQYGGSVKPENIKELISQEDVEARLWAGQALRRIHLPR